MHLRRTAYAGVTRINIHGLSEFRQTKQKWFQNQFLGSALFAGFERANIGFLFQKSSQRVSAIPVG